MNNPNIVILLADDQRFDTINALGNSEVHTPNIDALVNRGLSFIHAHIPGGTCAAVCMPSRAMLHTGRTLFHLQNEGQQIPDEHTLLGEFLQTLGYRCFGTGKWHNGSRAYARSFTDGGEIFFGGMWDHWNVPSYDYDPSGEYSQTVPYIKDSFHSNDVEMMQSNHISPGRHSTDLFAEKAISWIENSNDSSPFFLNIAFMAPHDPRSMPQRFLEQYKHDEVSLPDNFMSEHPFDYGIKSVRDELLTPYPRTEEAVKQHLSEYYAMITHLDDAVGRVVAALEQKGVLEDTLIIFAGDNGLALGQHGLFGKQSAYEHSVRVPLIFAGPGIPEGQQRQDNCYLLDIFPTIAEYLNQDIPDSVEGNSLFSSIVHNDGSGHRGQLYFAYQDKLRAIKSGRYKLIEYVNDDFRRTQLFNLETDPLELNNLADSHQETVNKLRNSLAQLSVEWGDRGHQTGKLFWNNYTKD